MWNHYERLHNHNKTKHNKTVCIFIAIYWKTENVYNPQRSREIAVHSVGIEVKHTLSGKIYLNLHCNMYGKETDNS